LPSLNLTSTSYPDVNHILNTLYTGVESILGSRLIGLYLYGSLASGDFNPETSDLDFVFVTTAELPSEIVSQLEALHAQLWASGLKWAAKLEGTYIPQSALRHYDPNGPLCPCVNEGKFYLARHDSDWVIQRHVLYHRGVVIAGPALIDLIDPVDPDDLRRGVLGILQAWWVPNLASPAMFQRSEYQAYAILTMCRALYTLQHGLIASKLASARWAQTALGDDWSTLIEWAIRWTHATQTDQFQPTLNFIRYTLFRIAEYNAVLK